jgi:hypothetical protein
MRPAAVTFSQRMSDDRITAFSVRQALRSDRLRYCYAKKHLKQ